MKAHKTNWTVAFIRAVMDLQRGVTLLASTLFLWDAIHQGCTSKGDVHLRLDSYLLVLIRPHEAGASAGWSLIDVIVGECVPNGAVVCFLMTTLACFLCVDPLQTTERCLDHTFRPSNLQLCFTQRGSVDAGQALMCLYAGGALGSTPALGQLGVILHMEGTCSHAESIPSCSHTLNCWGLGKG